MGTNQADRYPPINGGGGGLTTVAEVDNYTDLLTAISDSDIKQILVAPGDYTATEDLALPVNKRIDFQGAVNLDLGATYKITTAAAKIANNVYAGAGMTWSAGNARFEVTNATGTELWDGYLAAGTELWFNDRVWKIDSHGTTGAVDYIVPVLAPRITATITSTTFSLVTTPTENLIVTGSINVTETDGRTGKDNLLIDLRGLKKADLGSLTITRTPVSDALNIIAYYTCCIDSKFPRTSFMDSLLNGAIPKDYDTPNTLRIESAVINCSFEHISSGMYHTGTSDGHPLDFCDLLISYASNLRGSVCISGVSCDPTGSILTRQAARAFSSSNVTLVGPLAVVTEGTPFTQLWCTNVKHYNG